VRDGVLSPWVIAAWAAGGAAGVLLFQGTDGQAIEPLTGAAAWVLSSVIGRAVFLGMGTTSSLHLAALAGVIGPAVAWPVAGLITAAVNAQLEAPWSWALVGLCAGALQGLLEESRRGWRFAVVQAILRAAMAALLALGAGFVSEGGPLGWILTGAAVWLVPGLLYRPHDRHAQPVARVAMSPNGTFALSGSADGSIGLWELDQRTLVGFVRQQGGPVYAVAFSHDGLSCASGGTDMTVRVVDGNSGDQRFGFSGHTDAVLSVAFSPADGLLASGSADARIRLWDLSAGAQAKCLEGHTGAVTSVVFSRDGGRLLSAGLDGTVRIWDVVEGKETALLAVNKPAYAAVFTPDGRRVLVAADNGLSLWDAGNLELVHAFTGHAGAVHGVAVAADGERILSAGADGTVRLWAAAGEELACIRGHRGPVRGVAFAPDARSAISGGDDGSVRIFGFPDSPLEDPPPDDDADDFAS
jgi:hypothetical protein